MNLEPFIFILERLADLLKNEITTLSTDTKAVLESLQQELQLCQSYLMDVDQLQRQATITHVWQTKVQYVMGILPDIEDLLDTFYPTRGTLFENFTSFFSQTSNPLLRKHFLVKKAARIKEKLSDILQKAEGYQLPNDLPQLTLRRRLLTQPFLINDEFIIGLEEDVDTLITKLLSTNLGIVGMGGSGKTTLTRRLYNHKEILDHFSRRAWVCVSQDWDTPQILHQICLQVGVQIDEMSEIPSLKLQEFLQASSCLVVLDDVWSMEALQELLPVLLSAGIKGRSRVLITTRNEKIVRFYTLGGFEVHRMRSLTREESWQLFSAIVSKNWQSIHSFEAEPSFALLGKEMLEKCNGLPLAIVALAGLLSAKGTIQEWQHIKKDVISRIMRQDSVSHDYGAVKEMLELSFSDLPYYLKPCFLYLGIFQEDREICVAELIHLWIGEGFLKSYQFSESETLEEVAEDFLDELVERCIVHVVRRDYEGKVEAIQIHDLIRDLCIEKAKDWNFYEILYASTSASMSAKPISHRTIVHHRSHILLKNSRRCRSFILLGDSVRVTGDFALSYKTKWLRVLHLVGVHLGDSAKYIGDLILLRYLRVVGCFGTENLAQSIKKLRNLLTLIYHDHWTNIPNNMLGSMEHLRYLYLPYGWHETSIFGVDKSRSLQFLRATSGEWAAYELRTVSISVQELRLTDIHSQPQLEAISDFVSANPSGRLHTLFLFLSTDSGLEFDIQMMKLEHSRLLKHLVLEGKIRKQHRPLLFPPNLLSLYLNGTQIEESEDFNGALAQLGQLRSLKVHCEAYMGSKLTMTGLPRLEELSLSDLSNLKEWRIENVAMSRLKILGITSCMQLGNDIYWNNMHP